MAIKINSKNRKRELSGKLDNLIQFRQGWSAEPAMAISDPSTGHVVGVGYRSKKKPGVSEHFKRAAGAYAGGVGVPAALLAAATISERGKGAGALRRVLKQNGVGQAVGAAGAVGTVAGLFTDQVRRVSQLNKDADRRASLDLALLNRRKKRDVKLLSSILDQLIQFGDPRPRNPLGQFSDENDGVADPNSMARTYRGVSKGAGLVAAAAAGGAGGTLGSSAVKALIDKVKKFRNKPKL